MVTAENSLEQSIKSRQRLRATLPSQIADHQLIGLIAEGSYGDVWLAQNNLTGTFRAIKIIWRESFTTSKPYEREFEAIRRFEPRLEKVTVRIELPDESNPSMRFRVDAPLQVEPAPEPVSFETILPPGSSHFVIVGEDR